MRLIKLIALIYLLLLFIVGVTVVVAQNSPPRHPLAQFQFYPCADRACFMGIKPGETSLIEAKRILLANGGREYGKSDIGINVGAYEVHALSFNASPNITAIDVRLNLQLVTVMSVNSFASNSDFLEEFGHPCAISHIVGSPEVELIYPYMRLYVFMPSDRIEIGLPLSAYSGTFAITEPNKAVCNHSEPGQMVQWRGFASLDFYRAHGLQDQ